MESTAERSAPIDKWMTLIGPLATVFTLNIALFTTPTRDIFFLSFIVIIGLALCVASQRTGLTIATALLFFWTILTAWTLPIAGAAWTIGLSSSLVLSFFLTAWAWDEVKVPTTVIKQQANPSLVAEYEATLQQERTRLRERDAQLHVEHTLFEKLKHEVERLNQQHQQQEQNWLAQIDVYKKVIQECDQQLDQKEQQLSKRSEQPHVDNSQLREQFKEKSKVLDQTRHELFHTKEQLQNLQMKVDENERYGRSQEVVELEKHIMRLEQQMATAAKEYENEIDALHGLIATLLAR